MRRLENNIKMERYALDLSGPWQRQVADYCDYSNERSCSIMWVGLPH